MATRWVTNDLLGWLRKHRKSYIVGDYNYPALATETNTFKDPLHRVVGEGLCPEMGKNASWAEGIKASYLASEGAHVFNSLFQGEPSNEQGNLFKADDWQEYEISKHWPQATLINGEWISTPERDAIIRQFDRVYLSIDATFKGVDTADFVGMEVTGIKQGNTYLRYLVRKQMDLPDTIDKILYLVKKFPEISVIYIEDKANGPGIVSVIKKWRKKLGIPESDFPSVVPVEPDGSKYSRAQVASAYQRDGRCYIPCEKDAHLLSSPDDFVWDESELSYAHCYKQELGTFPFAGNDDLVDAFAQGIKKAMGLLSGTEKPSKQPERFTRYSVWWPEMEADYKALKKDEEKKAFIRQHGANMKWKPREEGGVTNGT
jgi:phage terminase large subunit-like protein